MTVFIYPNFEKIHSKTCTEEAVSTLLALSAQVCLPVSARDILPLDTVTYLPPDEAARTCDAMISVGGDGTILKCAGLASTYDKPLLGINCGRLGFMTSLERDELPLLKRLISGDYTVEPRMMLSASIVSDGVEKTCLTGLNEAVIYSGGRGIEDFRVSADSRKISSLPADGIIFSTPTGASAYSLSAGGPLIEPTLDCIEFTQICPHSLFARTMLFSPEKTIEVGYGSRAGAKASLSVDGSEPVVIEPEERVIIKRSSRILRLIDLKGGSYFNAIRQKLMQPTKPEN